MKPEEKKKRWKKAEEMIKSRKEQKRLEKVRIRKRSKLDRSKILAQLKECQLTVDQMDLFHSTSSMQTTGLKKFSAQGIDDPSRLDKIDEIQRAERCLDAAALLAKKRPRRNRNRDKPPESSSEDTDAMSSDSDGDEVSNPDEAIVDNQTTNGNHQAVDEVHSSNEENSESNNEIKPKIDEKLESQSNISIPLAPEMPPAKPQPAIFVEVKRDPEVEKNRLQLPIINEEQNIMETIRYNDVVIVSGETGSGKTTQIPQFLYEAGYALNDKMICITEPRRVAAVSMSERVAKELSLTDKEVSYQIRFSGNVSDETKIKFVTDGVLVRECQHDFLLKRYSVIIIDEAHERSVFSDILIGLLSRIVPMRAKQNDPLKLIIMSATLRVDDFVQNKHLFKVPPPIINIDARQFPVTCHFAKLTPANYLTAAYKKAKAINSKMPKGGILIFVTSQMDVKVLCKKLSALKEFHCMGLYAMLPLAKQRLVFKQPPDNKRLCVVATNVAETSITIPNIKYVIDSGKEKRKIYNLSTGVSRLITCWASKSSAEQRKGRAGRMGPGHCFRLYSSAVFSNEFSDFSQPPILGKPVEDVVLQMKSMNIDNVVNFPFPTRPSLDALMEAEKKLITLGALDDSQIKNATFKELQKIQYSSRLTPLGKCMSKFALSPRYSKMMVLCKADLIHHVIALVSALTVREMFLISDKWREMRRKWCGQGNTKLLGDFSVMLRAVIKADEFDCSSKECTKLGLRTKAMLEIFKLRKQLLQEYKSNVDKDINVDELPKLTKPSDSDAKRLRQLLLSSFGDHVARKVPDGYRTEKDPNDPNKVVKIRIKNAYECMETLQLVYIDQQSVMRGIHPECLIYKELVEGDKKLYMRDVASIDPAWLNQ